MFGLGALDFWAFWPWGWGLGFRFRVLGFLRLRVTARGP